jgi:hypothetical protein
VTSLQEGEQARELLREVLTSLVGAPELRLGERPVLFESPPGFQELRKQLSEAPVFEKFLPTWA